MVNSALEHHVVKPFLLKFIKNFRIYHRLQQKPMNVKMHGCLLQVIVASKKSKWDPSIFECIVLIYEHMVSLLVSDTD